MEHNEQGVGLLRSRPMEKGTALMPEMLMSTKAGFTIMRGYWRDVQRNV